MDINLLNFMDMKRNVLLVGLLFLSYTTMNARACSCGNFSSGTYDYTTADTPGRDCCNDTVSPKATYTTWVWSGGAYEVDEITDITGASAQVKCCPST